MSNQQTRREYLQLATAVGAVAVPGYVGAASADDNQQDGTLLQAENDETVTTTDQSLSLPFGERFSEDLNGWDVNQRFRTGDEREPDNPTPGDGGYSEEYDGSVRLHVDGGPSTIGVAHTTSGISAGTTISVTYHAETSSPQPGRVGVAIFAPDGDDNDEEIVVSTDGEVTSGKTTIRGTVENEYPEGTELRVFAGVWPGEYTAYVTQVHTLTDERVSFEQASPGANTPAEPWSVIRDQTPSDFNSTEIAQANATDGSQSLHLSGNGDLDRINVGTTADLTEVATVLCDVYLERANVSWGEVFFGTFTSQDDNNKIIKFLGQAGDSYGATGQFTDLEGDVTDVSGEHEILFNVRGDNEAYFDNLRFYDDGGTLIPPETVIGGQTASFTVEIIETNSPVAEGELLTVGAEVTNNSEEAVTRTIELLDVDGSVVDESSVSLGAAEQNTVSLDWQTETGDAAEGEITVRSDGVTDTAPVTVENGTTDGPVTTLSPQNGEIRPGSSTTVDVVIGNAERGVSGYLMDISVGDSAIAAITDYELTNDPQFPNSTLAEDGSTLNLAAGMGDNVHDAGDVVIATFTVEATAEGETALTASNVEVTDKNDEEYTIADVNGATLTISEQAGPPPVVGDRPPKDPDGDGLFQDVNGDGDVNIFDVQTLFSNLDTDAVQNNPAAYNFSGDENPTDVNVFDVQALFSTLTESESAALDSDSEFTEYFPTAEL